MHLRFIVSLLLALFLCACANNAVKPDNTYQSAKDPGPNYHKAALLNVELGEGYLAQGQISRAKQKFIHALELEPKLPEAHSSIGYFYENVSDMEEAEQHYKKAISYAENKGRFYNNYGTFLCRQGRYQEAEKAFNNAIKDKKYINTAEVYENAGVCELKKPDVNKAITYLETAIKRDPQRPVAYLELANIAYDKKSYKLARDYLNYYHDLKEPNARSLWLGIRVNKNLQDKKALAADAKKLKSLFPNSQQYQSYLETIAHE